MKKSMIVFTAAVMLTGGIYSSCQTSAEKADTAQVKVQDAKKDLTEAQKDAATAEQKAAEAQEWQAFKADTDAKIKENDTYIAEFKAKMKATGKKMDAQYTKSIETLEQKNKDLKARVDAYGQQGQSDWASFKREFNHDMDELGKALKDLTVNNKK
jgi:transposase